MYMCVWNVFWLTRYRRDSLFDEVILNRDLNEVISGVRAYQAESVPCSYSCVSCHCHPVTDHAIFSSVPKERQVLLYLQVFSHDIPST